MLNGKDIQFLKDYYKVEKDEDFYIENGNLFLFHHGENRFIVQGNAKILLERCYNEAVESSKF